MLKERISLGSVLGNIQQSNVSNCSFKRSRDQVRTSFIARPLKNWVKAAVVDASTFMLRIRSRVVAPSLFGRDKLRTQSRLLSSLDINVSLPSIISPTRQI